MLRAVGTYLDVIVFIAVGAAAWRRAPQWASKKGTPENVQRRVARMRLAGIGLLVSGVGLLLFRVLGV